MSSSLASCHCSFNPDWQQAGRLRFRDPPEHSLHSSVMGSSLINPPYLSVVPLRSMLCLRSLPGSSLKTDLPLLLFYHSFCSTSPCLQILLLSIRDGIPDKSFPERLSMLLRGYSPPSLATILVSVSFLAYSIPGRPCPDTSSLSCGHPFLLIPFNCHNPVFLVAIPVAWHRAFGGAIPWRRVP